MNNPYSTSSIFSYICKYLIHDILILLFTNTSPFINETWIVPNTDDHFIVILTSVLPVIYKSFAEVSELHFWMN